MTMLKLGNHVTVNLDHVVRFEERTFTQWQGEETRTGTKIEYTRFKLTLVTGLNEETCNEEQNKIIRDYLANDGTRDVRVVNCPDVEVCNHVRIDDR